MLELIREIQVDTFDTAPYHITVPFPFLTPPPMGIAPLPFLSDLDPPFMMYVISVM